MMHSRGTTTQKRIHRSTPRRSRVSPRVARAVVDPSTSPRATCRPTKPYPIRSGCGPARTHPLCAADQALNGAPAARPPLATTMPPPRAVAGDESPCCGGLDPGARSRWLGCPAPPLRREREDFLCQHRQPHGISPVASSSGGGGEAEMRSGDPGGWG